MPKAASTWATVSSLRKEGAADRGGEVAVDREVVPFEHIADGAGGDDPACAADSHRNASPKPSLRIAARGVRIKGSRSIVGASMPTGEDTAADGARGKWPASRKQRSSSTS